MSYEDVVRILKENCPLYAAIAKDCEEVNQIHGKAWPFIYHNNLFGIVYEDGTKYTFRRIDNELCLVD